MKSLQLKDDLFWIGALDPDLRIFDIIMHTEYGTTYNSYILKGSEKIALFETVKVKFWDEYLEKLSTYINPADIDYIVVDHTEPDHSGSIEKLLELAPKAKIVGSAAAIKYLKDIANRDFDSIIVKDGFELSLGNKTLQFVSAPMLHWPDSIFTYVKEDKLLVTCDFFGAHYCHDDVLLSTVKNKEGYVEAFDYYFNMIMGPFKPFVLRALKKIEDLEIEMVCTGHGPVLDENIDWYREAYKERATEHNPNKKKTVIIPYVSAYGYTKEMAELLRDGIKEAGDIHVELHDMVHADEGEVLEKIYWADGLLVGSPTMVGDALPPINLLIQKLNPVIHGGKHAAAFGSYGWSGEAVPHLTTRLKQLRMKLYSEGLTTTFKPSEAFRQEVLAFGKGFGEKVLG